MPVRDIMEADVPTVSPQQPVADAIRLLRDHDLPGVPVINEGGRCIGIITENDLVLSDAEGDLHLPHYIQLFGGIIYLESLHRFEDRLRKAFASTVEEMMTPDPITVDADAEIDEAARLIAKHRHNRLPVVEHGRFVGIVTRLDVLEALYGE
ncbi:MAG: domain containing rane protein [Solirubrobacterales bacterium]|jgi:CBS domain-containing protein|nr:domain containing rane protein [Solirubrobacterales bacterium]